MRMLMKVSIPAEQGNRGVKEGILARTILGFVEKMSPEACYFVAEKGNRMGYFFFDLKETSQIPSAAEPFFLNLGAGIEMTPAMSLEDVRVGLEKALKSP